MLLTTIEEEVRYGDNFGFKITNGKLHFNVNGKKNVLGSKMFPLGKKNASIFKGGKDKPTEYVEVAKVLEDSNWKHESGMCYTYAEILQKVFIEFGIDAKYYSGWVFTEPSYPVHHAWVVVDGFVYDISVHVKSQSKLIEMLRNGEDPYSKESVREMQRVQNDVTPITESFVWGNVPGYMIYVGSEETPITARKKYTKCIEGFPEHPSYPNINRDGKFGKTRIQKLLDGGLK